MKGNYEQRASSYLLRRTPVIIRVDGKTFHTYTRGMGKPFDGAFVDAMIESAKAVAKEAQGFKCAYIQSDEASFLLSDFNKITTAAWFDYKQAKIETISASVMTAKFNQLMDCNRLAHFDSRAFNIPTEEVANYFLWRSLDWQRNSLSMFCRSFFSHKQMANKNRTDQHEMLHKHGHNWAVDVTEQNRNGTWLIGDIERTDILPTYNNIFKAVDDLPVAEFKENTVGASK